MRRRYVVVIVSRERLLRMSLRNVFVWGASLRAFTWAANAFVAKMPMAHNARNPTRPFAAIRCVGERQFSCRRTAAHEPTHTLTARLPARRLARVYQTEFQSEKIVRIDKTRWISRIGPSICVLFHFILFCSVFIFIVFFFLFVVLPSSANVWVNRCARVFASGFQFILRSNPKTNIERTRLTNTIKIIRDEAKKRREKLSRKN